MVSVKDEPATKQVVSEVPAKFNYSQKFLACGAILPLRLQQYMTGIAYDNLPAILQLRQHSTDSVIRSIRVQDELIHRVWIQ